jgi:hypothetical protein
MRFLDTSTDWKYGGANYDYDSTGCLGICDDQYCRCNKIVNARITSVSIPSLTKYITEHTKDMVEKYCVDRILRIHKIYESDNWYIQIGGGYYGEEVYKVTLECGVVSAINDDLIELEKIESDSNKIKFILRREYGYLLDVIKDLKFSIEKIKRDDIKIPNDHYHGKISAANYVMYLTESYYTNVPQTYNFDGPVGVLREDDAGNLILVDGYHRYSASAHRKRNTKLRAVVGRKP